MKVRVKADSRWPRIYAFGGHEYTQDEWRLVPDGYEAAAKAHDQLEVQAAPRKAAPRKRKVKNDQPGRTDQ